MLHVVAGVALPRVVRLRVVVLGRAVEPDRDHRERHRRAQVVHLGLQQRYVGQTRRAAGLVDTADHRLDVVEEQRGRADDGEVLLAGLDERVAGFVRAQARIDEVDCHPAAGDAAVGVDEFGEGPDAVDGPGEEAGPSWVVDVGDDRDADRLRGDADLALPGWLRLRAGLRRRQCRGECDGGDNGAKRAKGAELTHEQAPSLGGRRVSASYRRRRYPDPGTVAGRPRP